MYSTHETSNKFMYLQISIDPKIYQVPNIPVTKTEFMMMKNEHKKKVFGGGRQKNLVSVFCVSVAAIAFCIGFYEIFIVKWLWNLPSLELH